MNSNHLFPQSPANNNALHNNHNNNNNNNHMNNTSSQKKDNLEHYDGEKDRTQEYKNSTESLEKEMHSKTGTLQKVKKTYI